MPALENKKQEDFCQAFVNGKTRGNGTESMRVAGYSEGHCKGGATRLKCTPAVKIRLAELEEVRKQNVDSKLDCSIETLLEKIDRGIKIAEDQKNPKLIFEGCMKICELVGWKDNPTEVRERLGIEERKTPDNENEKEHEPFMESL